MELIVETTCFGIYFSAISRNLPEINYSNVCRVEMHGPKLTVEEICKKNLLLRILIPEYDQSNVPLVETKQS